MTKKRLVIWYSLTYGIGDIEECRESMTCLPRAKFSC